jgi:hypothetical protein
MISFHRTIVLNYEYTVSAVFAREWFFRARYITVCFTTTAWVAAEHRQSRVALGTLRDHGGGDKADA